MSFPRYPAYKDSGIEWIKVVPTHWSIMPMYSVVGECDEPNVGMKENNLLSLSYGHIVPKDINSNDGLLPQSFETYQVVEPNDIVLRLTDLQNDQRSLRSAIVHETGIITSAYLAVRPRAITPAYLGHLLRAYDLTKVFYSMGGGLRQSMKFGDLKRLPLLVPPREEQKRIAEFLDRETAKIDALVAEQERLIALLKEKRQAVISHAVTKGLDPSVPMKDSGVEWLGQVPAHWGVTQFRRHVAIAEGQVNPEEPPYSEMVLIAPNHLESGTGRLLARETASEQGAESGKYLCAKGSVIYSKIRPALRKVCIAPTDCLCSADMYPLMPHSGLNGDFLLWYMLSDEFSTLAVLESERVAMPKINRETLNPIPLVIPPEDEQHNISTYLKTRTHEFGRLIAEASAAVELLRERRSALISAAVTGQIDVRGLVTEQVAA